MKRVIFVLALTLAGAGCSPLRAPDIALKTAGIATASLFPRPSAMGITDLCDDGASLCGTVGVDLKPANENDHWTYWKAGTNEMVYQPSDAFQAGPGWDMRITKDIPLVGSNGGKTAADEGWVNGKAAFAVIPDAEGSFIPKKVSDVLRFQFQDDVYASLTYQGLSLEPEYQNALVNNIGPGLLRGYAHKSDGVHIDLSNRIFILRAADGVSYYAIRFYFYSFPSSVLAFEWRKLQK